jgi:hypothetical protein
MADAYGSGPYGETRGGSTPLVSNTAGVVWQPPVSLTSFPASPGFSRSREKSGKLDFVLGSGRADAYTPMFMKFLSRLTRATALSTLAIIVASCACIDLGVKVIENIAYRLVNAKTHRIVFEPGNNVPSDIWDRINTRLQKHPLCLYKIQRYQDGKRVGQPIGSLCDLFLVRKMDYIDSCAKDLKFSGRAIQVGTGAAAGDDAEDAMAGHPHMAVAGHPHIARSSSSSWGSHPHIPAAVRESAELVSEVAPLLQQTNPKPTPTPAPAQGG